jgi:outer membrane protein assembly factor BamB
MKQTTRVTFVVLYFSSMFLFTSSCNKTTPVEEVSLDESKPLEPVAEASFGSDDWPAWRGPNRNGIADDQSVPVSWNTSENIVWKSDVPGRGHSSPTVVGDRIFLTTADEAKQTQSVICFERHSGKQLWITPLSEGGFPQARQMHEENSHASCTVACDGQHLFVAFLNHEAIHVSALDLEGKILWQKKAGSFDSNFGYAPSPTIHKSLVIVAADHQGGGFLAAYHRKTGDIVWRKQRPVHASYSSPIVANVAGKDQLLISGAFKVWSYNPDTGEENWSVKGTARSTCGTVIVEDELVFASGGWPESETLCIKADGSGKVLWRITDKSYVTSILSHKGYLYSVDSEQGTAYCWNAQTGKQAWQQRLPGGKKIRSSPSLVRDNLYITNVRGTTYVLKADPKKYQLVAQNQLGNECYSTPSICGGKIYLRAAERSSKSRKETLYCIGTTGAQ